MRRAEVWWVDFDPSVGGESRKVRPEIIISNDAANGAVNRVQVVPLTGSTGRLYPSEAIATLDGKQSETMADQLTTTSKLRLKARLGSLAKSEMQAVEQAIKIQLGLKL